MELATPPPVQPITVVAAAPAIEPSLPDGGCAIGGHAVSLVGDSIDLCGALGTKCFGRLPAHTYTGVIVESLRVAPSLAAHMVLSANGITVSSIVDARNVEPHPQHVELIDRWFVPESARFSFVRVRDGAAELSVEHGADVTPAAPLAVDWPCDRLTSELARFDLTEIETALGLGHASELFIAKSSGALDIRTSPNGAPVAQLRYDQQPVYVHAHSGGRARGIIPVDGGWVVGWIDAAKLVHPTSGSHRTRAPNVRMGVSAYGVRCEHDVDVLVQVGEATVHAATIHAGTAFDPKDGADAFRRVGVDLIPGVSAHIDPRSVEDCD